MAKKKTRPSPSLKAAQAKKHPKGSKNMAAARIAKAKKRRSTTVAQQSERVQCAFGLMLVHRPVGVRRMLMAEFDIAKSSADSIISKANKLIRAEFTNRREELVCEVLHQVEHEIQRSKGLIKLRALQMKIDLLGLSAPTKVVGSFNHTQTPFDPAQTEAMEDPKLRDQILLIEEKISEKGVV